jgi:hypothetical protein
MRESIVNQTGLDLLELKFVALGIRNRKKGVEKLNLKFA